MLGLGELGAVHAACWVECMHDVCLGGGWWGKRRLPGRNVACSALTTVVSYGWWLCWPAGVQGRAVAHRHGGGGAVPLLCPAGGWAHSGLPAIHARLFCSLPAGMCACMRLPATLLCIVNMCVGASMPRTARYCPALYRRVPQDLRDLFRLEASECESSRTQRELHGMHAHQRRETPALREHLQFLRTLDCYAGGVVGEVGSWWVKGWGWGEGWQWP
jgi:hypothetical protein